VDSTFGFLSSTQVQLLDDILSRRNPTLLNRIRNSDAVSRSDAEEIVSTLSEEFTNNLDDDWEPTDYGRTVNSILAQVNAAQIEEWPE
jgi:flagellar motor switch protein FliG